MTVKSPREKLLLMIVLGVGGFAIALHLIISPLQNAWSARQKQIKDLRAQVAEGQQLLKRETVIRDNWNTKSGNALPANTSLAEQQFVKALDGWAGSSGAQITSITPQWKKDSTNYLTLECRLEAAGSLGTLSRFLYDVQKGPLPLRLDTMELSTRDAQGQQLTLALEVSGLALVQAEKKAEVKK